MAKKDIKNISNNWEEETYKSIDPKIIINRIKTPDGTILTSRHVHDYVVYVDKNGLTYMVDGGLDYLRRNYYNEKFSYEELSVLSSDPFEKIRESLEWGSYGKTGKEKLHYITLCNMTDDHIKAIINLNLGANYIRGFLKKELIYRKKNNISIKD